MTWKCEKNKFYRLIEENIRDKKKLILHKLRSILKDIKDEFPKN